MCGIRSQTLLFSSELDPEWYYFLLSLRFRTILFLVQQVLGTELVALGAGHCSGVGRTAYGVRAQVRPMGLGLR